MKLEFASRNHVGLVRARNEDACYARLSDSGNNGSGGIFAVADGMGGHPGGEVASELAIAAVRDGAGEPRQAGQAPADPPADMLRRIFRAASNRIEDRGAREPHNREMGTTLTVALADHGLIWAAHIGDSRLYWIRGRKFVQITRDHTMAQDLVDAGLLHPSMADRHPSSHVLTRCLGTCPDQDPDVLEIPLAMEAGDRLLLASDGLVKVVKPSVVPGLIEGRTAASAAEELLKASLAGGAPDNVTVVVVIVTEPGSRDPSATCHDFEGASDCRWSRG